MLRDPTLHVRSGRHAGATIALESRTLSAGRDVDCDIVLSEPSIEGRHFQLVTGASGIDLIALDGAIEVAGQGRIEPGYRAKIKSAIRFTAGDVDLDLEMSEPRSLALPLSVTGGVLAAGLTAASFAMGWIAPAGTTSSPGVEAERMQVQASLPASTEDAAREPSTMPDYTGVSQAVLDRLNQAGLSDVTLDYEDRLIRLAGQIESDQLPDFRAFQRWFDESYPTLVLQSERVRIRADRRAVADPPVVQSVWRIGRPHIIVGGKRYYAGDALPGGWRLDRINLNTLEMTFDGRPYRIEINPEAPQDSLAMR